MHGFHKLVNPSILCGSIIGDFSLVQETTGTLHLFLADMGELLLVLLCSRFRIVGTGDKCIVMTFAGAADLQ